MFDITQIADIIEACENLLQKRRPPEDIRHQVDLNYRIDDQSVLIFEIRSRWDKKDGFLKARLQKLRG